MTFSARRLFLAGLVFAGCKQTVERAPAQRAKTPLAETPAERPTGWVEAGAEGARPDGRKRATSNAGEHAPRAALGVNLGFYGRLLNGGGRVFRKGFRPGREGAAEAAPFDRSFLALLAPFSVLRFHQFHGVSFSAEKEWSDRAPPTTELPLTDEALGEEEVRVPYEWQIRLCNAAGADYWVTVPALASRAYVVALAELIAAELDEGLRVWVESSNEVWNGSYAEGAGWDPTPDRIDGQHTIARRRGRALGAGRGPEEDVMGEAAFGYVRTSLEVFRGFAEVFGKDSPRVVEVIAWIAPEVEPGHRWNSLEPVFRALESPAVTRFDGQPAGVGPDVIAVNPYFQPPEDAKDRWGELEASLERLDASLAWGRKLVEAHDPDLGFVGYEGGQHVVGGDAGAMNRDPRMYRLYRRWLEISTRHLDLVAHYALVTPFSEHEAFGLKERIGQPPSEAHKWRALVDAQTPPGPSQR